MRSRLMSFPIRWVMIAVAIVASVLGAFVSSSSRPMTRESVLTSLSACFAIPILIGLGRKVLAPECGGTVASRWTLVADFRFALLYGGLCAEKSGRYGLIGGTLAMMLLIGWTSLTIAASTSSRRLA